MLVVPFGRRDLLGVVVGLAEGSEVAPERLLAPRRAVEGDVPVELVELAGWIAREYCSTPARALSLVLPPGAGAGVARPRPPRRGADRRRARGADVGRAADGAPARRARAARAARRGRRRRSTGADHGTLRRLEARGLVRAAPRRGRPHAPSTSPSARAATGRVVLGADQERALATLEAAIAARRFEALLLHGVTGSGKTEVYLRAAEAALAQGRGVIVLVPEIGLTPQTVTRFIERFGDASRSRTRASPRASATTSGCACAAARRGSASGPRSAVFAPIERLGLIVVDEEHDSSYKHEGDPRYDAREVAMRRAAARRRGAGRRQRDAAARELRAAGAARAARARRRQPAARRRGARHARRARRAARPHGAGARASCAARAARASCCSTAAAGRTSSRAARCGKVWGCPECDVALVLHRAEGEIACHHCGHRERVPAALRRLRVAQRRAPRPRHRAPRARAGERARRRGPPDVPPRRRRRRGPRPRRRRARALRARARRAC